MNAEESREGYMEVFGRKKEKGCNDTISRRKKF